MARILIIADTFPPNRGGSEGMLAIIAQALAEAGHEVRVYTPVATEAGYWAPVAGVEVRRSRIWLTLHRLGGHRNALVSRVARLGVIAWLLGRLVWRRYDLIIAGHPLPAGVVANLLRDQGRSRATMVLTYGEEITMYSRGSRLRRMLQRALRGADAVVTIAECNRQELEDIEAGISEKLVVIPPAIESRKTPRHLDTIRLTGKPVLFTISRLVERKGIDTTIAAVAMLKDEFPQMRYYVAGRGPDEVRLQALADKLGVADRVIFLGPVPAPDFLFPQSDIFCMPNRMLDSGEREGFGMVFLEAGLHGVTSIAGRSGGAVEAVLDGETGVLVTPNSVEAVAEAIRKLANDEELRRRLGEGARKYAESFSRRRMAQAYVASVADMLSGDKGK